MKMRVCMPATSQAVPCRSSFSSIREVRKEIKGKADEVSQSKGECKVKLIGDSLCRHLGKKKNGSKVSGNEYFLGAGVELVAERLHGLTESDSSMCLVVRGKDVLYTSAKVRRCIDVTGWLYE